METPRYRDHLRGKIDADAGDALLMKVSGYVPRTTTEIGHETAPSRLFGEPVQEMAVERLAL